MANNEITEIVVNGNTYTIASTDTNLAPVETNANSASKSYTVGEHLVVNNTYCKVIAAISAGDTLVIGTNIEKVMVAEAIEENSEAIAQINAELTAQDDLQFRFASDGEGNHGYLGADDSFIPFNNIYYLGEYDIASIDISSKYSDYSKLTVDNILLVPNTIRAGTMTYANGNRNWAYASAAFNYTYDSTTGIITTNGRPRANDGCSYGDAWVSNVKVYIVEGVIRIK